MSSQSKEMPFEKTHLRPLHWQRGVEVFHEESMRFSEVLPSKVGLILNKRSSTSVVGGDWVMAKEKWLLLVEEEQRRSEKQRSRVWRREKGL